MMLKLVARPLNAGEPDLLVGNEKEPLFIRAFGGHATLRVNPPLSWAHDALEAAAAHEDVNAFVTKHGGADAFLGASWIGSSEV